VSCKRRLPLSSTIPRYTVLPAPGSGASGHLVRISEAAMAKAEVDLHHAIGFGSAPPFRRSRFSQQVPMAGRSGPPPSHQSPQQPDIDDPNYESKRKKSVNRKTIDYNSSVVRALEDRIWQRDHRDRRALQPDICYYGEVSNLL
jgi:hypothetical protein